MVPTYSGPGRIGWPTKWSKRRIVKAAILYAPALGYQGPALPSCYPQWKMMLTRTGISPQMELILALNTFSRHTDEGSRSLR